MRCCPFADESYSWDALHAQYEMKRINHEEAYSMDCACTNWAEEFFSRMRRAEQGHHHHISGPYLLRYAQEARLHHLSADPATEVNSQLRFWEFPFAAQDFGARAIES